jgi:hypothetical protein
MFKVPTTSEDHRDAMCVTCLDDGLITARTAGLNDRDNARFGSRFNRIGKGEKCV